MIINAWLRGWDHFWFGHASARNIAAARIIVAAQGLWVVLSRDYAAISGLPPGFWTHVRETSQWRYLLFHGHPQIETVVQVVAIIALLAALAGVYARIACLMAALALYHLAPLETIIWSPDAGARGLTVTVLALMVLSWSRCADAITVGKRPANAPSDPRLAYSWQLRLIQLFLCQIYLFSALAKLRTGGIGWMTADNLQHWFFYLNQVPDFVVFEKPGLWMAKSRVMSLLTAITTIAFEAGFIIVMFWHASRRVIIPMAFLFHGIIVFTLNLTFAALPLLLIFVNWGWVNEKLRGAPSPLTQQPSS